MTGQLVAGFDIGGTGIKFGVVDPSTGEMMTERFRIDTPQPAVPGSVSAVLAAGLEQLDWQGPFGVAFPGVIGHTGIVETAPNLGPGWIGNNIGAAFALNGGEPTAVVNDADAAGIAEARFGAAGGVGGVVAVLTVGTGIGSALLVDGKLVPNTEFGHMHFKGRKVEDQLSNRVRKAKGQTVRQWAKRFDRFLAYFCEVVNPELIVIGGGMAKRFDDFADLITADVEVVPARLQNRAGVVGAALAAATTTV